MSATDDNLSCVLYAKDEMRLEQRERATPAKGEVLIRVVMVGICGSDVHYWTHGAIGDFVVRAPMVLGHETSGVVAALGDGVTTLKVGDRVALEPGVACRRCAHCATGRYNLCPDMKFFATPPVHGTLTRYVTHPAELCFRIPDNLSFEEGALIEPLSVGVHSVRRAGVQIGDTVAIHGAGPIGLLTLLVAKAAGAAQILLTDIDESRLGKAKELGANFTLNVKGLSASDAATKIRELLGRRPQQTIECTGVASSVETAILTTESGGTLVLVGLGAARAELPIIEAAVREVDVRGIFRYANSYPTAIELVASGRVDLSGISRAHYDLEQSPEAFARFAKQDVMKIFIHC